MTIFETLAPLVLLIALGAGLAHVRFLGREFMADLNKLAFWIALPALLFSSASHAAEPARETVTLLAVLLAATVVVTLAGWGVCFLMRIPATVHGTLMQSAFRGNLAYIGIPVLTYSMPDNKVAIATAVVAMIALMIVYNVLAVVALQSGTSSGANWRGALRAIATNPLVLSGGSGLVLSYFHVPLPGFLHRALSVLGGAAVPIALLCIGGSLAVTSLRGRRSWIVAAAFLKVAALPVIMYLLAEWLQLGPAERRIALVFAACPTAAASYVMARQMGGDEALASGSIVLSTIASAFSLAAVLWVTG